MTKRGPRFSILPARAATDRRLSDKSLRVLVHMGSFTDQDGWCFPSQKTLADALECSRQFINKTINTLVGLGYIEKRTLYRDDGGIRGCEYRVLFDTDDSVATPCQPEMTTPATSGDDRGMQPLAMTTPETSEGDSITYPNELTQEGTKDSESVPFAELERIWNQLCGQKIGKIVKLGPTRKKHLAARFRDEFNGHVEQWRAYCERIAESAFLTSKPGPWMNFDWVVKPDNCIKILEGRYDDRRRAPAPAANQPTEREQEVLAWIRSDGLLMPTDGDPPTEAEIVAARAKWPERCTRDWTRRHATVAA